jgi:hypothetical protein
MRPAAPSEGTDDHPGTDELQSQQADWLNHPTLCNARARTPARTRSELESLAVCPAVVNQEVRSPVVGVPTTVCKRPIVRALDAPEASHRVCSAAASAHERHEEYTHLPWRHTAGQAADV